MVEPVAAGRGLPQPDTRQLVEQVLVVRQCDGVLAQQPVQRERQTTDALCAERELLHLYPLRAQALGHPFRLPWIQHEPRPIPPRGLDEPSLDYGLLHRMTTTPLPHLQPIE